MTAPAYLKPPKAPTKSYGMVRFVEGRGGKNYFEVNAEPQVMEFAKRLFPGTAARNHGALRVPSSRRLFGDLLWLMQRYPLTISPLAEREFKRCQRQAIEHATMKASGSQLKPATPPPTFLGELKPFQAEGVSYLIANQRTLLADDMGLGKTVTALAAIATAQAFPALVVVPTAVQRQWEHMAAAFLKAPSGDLFAQAAVLRGQKPFAIPNVPIVIIHYGIIAYWQEELREHGFKAVVFDEIQDLRHTGTEKYSAASLIAQDIDLAWGLSGTPIYGYGIEIWAVLNVLDFHCLGSSDAFTREWCTGYESKVVKDGEVLRAHLNDLGLMLRRRKSEVQSQLPEKQRARIDILHDEGEYGALMQQAVRLAKNFNGMAWTDRGKAAREMEELARRAAGVAKAPFVANFIDSLIAAGERPLVFAWHHHVHDILLDALKHREVLEISGRRTEAEKQAALKAFKAGEADALQLSLRSTAGLDGLQGVATCVVFAELDWSPAVHAQCEDRIHRMGYEGGNLLCYYLVSNTSFDLIMQEILGLKIGQFFDLMGDSGDTAEQQDAAQESAKSHMRALIARIQEGA